MKHRVAGQPVASPLTTHLGTTRPLFAHCGFTPVATFTDVDADGVIDDCDQCPASAPGAAVDYVGCP